MRELWLMQQVLSVPLCPINTLNGLPCNPNTEHTAPRGRLGPGRFTAAQYTATTHRAVLACCAGVQWMKHSIASLTCNVHSCAVRSSDTDSSVVPSGELARSLTAPARVHPVNCQRKCTASGQPVHTVHSQSTVKWNTVDWQNTVDCQVERPHRYGLAAYDS